MEKEEVLKELQNTKGKPKALTMGSSYNILKQFSKSPPDDFPEGMKQIYSIETIDILRGATSIRNDIAHRGLTSGHESKKKLVLLEKLNDKLQLTLRNFFSDYTMFSPISSTYDGRQYEYGIDYLDGLALNPCVKGKLSSATPLVDGDLYIGLVKDDGVTKCYHLFPLLLLDETIEESEFKAFYFYNDFSEEESDVKFNLRFVCPYPNVRMHKTKKLEIMGLRKP